MLSDLPQKMMERIRKEPVVFLVVIGFGFLIGIMFPRTEHNNRGGRAFSSHEDQSDRSAQRSDETKSTADDICASEFYKATKVCEAYAKDEASTQDVKDCFVSAENLKMAALERDGVIKSDPDDDYSANQFCPLPSKTEEVAEDFLSGGVFSPVPVPPELQGEAARSTNFLAGVLLGAAPSILVSYKKNSALSEELEAEKREFLEAIAKASKEIPHDKNSPDYKLGHGLTLGVYNLVVALSHSLAKFKTGEQEKDFEEAKSLCEKAKAAGARFLPNSCILFVKPDNYSPTQKSE